MEVVTRDPGGNAEGTSGGPTTLAGEGRKATTASGIEEAIVLLVRREMARRGQVAPEAPVPPSAREALLLLLMVSNLGLLWALFPETEGVTRLLFGFVVSLGGTSLTLGYAWFRRTWLRAMRQRAAVPLAGVTLIALLTLNLALNVPWMAVGTEPLQAHASPAWVSLRGAEVVTVRRLRSWREAKNRTYAIRPADAWIAAVGWAPLPARPLLCSTDVSIDPEDEAAEVTLERCTAVRSTAAEDVETCEPDSFDPDYQRAVIDESDPMPMFADAALVDEHVLQFPAETAAYGDLPVGRYRVTIRKTGRCDDLVREWRLDPKECRSLPVVKLTCTER